MEFFPPKKGLSRLCSGESAREGCDPRRGVEVACGAYLGGDGPPREVESESVGAEDDLELVKRMYQRQLPIHSPVLSPVQSRAGLASIDGA